MLINLTILKDLLLKDSEYLELLGPLKPVKLQYKITELNPANHSTFTDTIIQFLAENRSFSGQFNIQTEEKAIQYIKQILLCLNIMQMIRDLLLAGAFINSNNKLYYLNALSWHDDYTELNLDRDDNILVHTNGGEPVGICFYYTDGNNYLLLRARVTLYDLDVYYFKKIYFQFWNKTAHNDVTTKLSIDSITKKRIQNLINKAAELKKPY